MVIMRMHNSRNWKRFAFLFISVAWKCVFALQIFSCINVLLWWFNRQLHSTSTRITIVSLRCVKHYIDCTFTTIARNIKHFVLLHVITISINNNNNEFVSLFHALNIKFDSPITVWSVTTSNKSNVIDNRESRIGNRESIPRIIVVIDKTIFSLC